MKWLAAARGLAASHALALALALGALEALAFAPLALWALGPLCTAALFLL